MTHKSRGKGGHRASIPISPDYSVVIAHRGYSAVYPENTVLSVREALLSTPADGVEIDIHVSLDDQLILQHDETLERMTDGQGRVEDRPFAGYIDGLKTKGETGEGVALLSQVFEHLIQPGLSLVLDVKDVQSLRVLDLLKRFLDSRRVDGLRVYLGVWREDFARHARALFPRQTQKPTVLVTLIAEECTVDLLRSDLYDAFNLDVDRIQPEIVQEAAELGKDVLLWTCNSFEQIWRAKGLKVQGILTDDPFLV